MRHLRRVNTFENGGEKSADLSHYSERTPLKCLKIRYKATLKQTRSRGGEMSLRLNGRISQVQNSYREWLITKSQGETQHCDSF